jgi:hypothetical protein
MQQIGSGDLLSGRLAPLSRVIHNRHRCSREPCLAKQFKSYQVSAQE